MNKRAAAARTPATQIERVDPPLYRAIRFTAIRGIPFKVGETSEGGNEWPNLTAFEPVNETARTIADYMKRFGHSRCFPARPYDHFFDCYYLPAALPNGYPVHDQAGPRPSHPDYEDPPGAPVYTSKHAVHFASNVVIAAGQAFAWLRWPLQGWRAANEPAARIARYLAEHGGEQPHPDLKNVRAPWCELRGLFLPELRPIREKAAHSQPPIITSHGVLTEEGAIA